ncbi:MAG: glycosyltransferase family 4 protein [Gammaproteobacteria bacterium]|nr:glycosyltransferase family 4 protein [Gammaproteobacteria bacterium]
MPKRITIISSNVAGGGVLACAGIGRALERHYSVQLIGSLFGAEPWSGLDDLDFEVQYLRGKSLPAYASVMRKLQKLIDGDIVIAHQLRLPSSGIGLLHKYRKHVPCALYIDDDDLALTLPGRSNRWRDRLRAPSGDLYTRLVYKFARRADAIFCGSEYFANKFSGITVPLGRDAALYEPDNPERVSLRDKLGFAPNATVIGFLGNPRPHVGIEDLVQALEILDDQDLHLLVVPAGAARDDARELFNKTPANVRLIEHRPSSDVPGFLAATDIVVVPQRASPVSQGQLPARLVEGMAMAKPIVTTRIADVPELLGDAAVYVPDRDPAAIANAVRQLRADPALARQMGAKAREIFLKRLSLEAMADKLVPEIDRLLDRPD